VISGRVASPSPAIFTIPLLSPVLSRSPEGGPPESDGVDLDYFFLALRFAFFATFFFAAFFLAIGSSSALRRLVPPGAVAWSHDRIS
jgi:hypothetical protein